MMKTTRKMTLAFAAVAATAMMAAPALAQDHPTGDHPKGDHPTTAPDASLPSAKSLITKALDAMGGAKKMKQITDTHVKASMTTQMGDVTFETFRKGDTMYLLKINQMGMDISMGRNGDDAWMVNPMQGTVRVPLDQFKSQADQSPNPLMFGDVGEKYKTIETVGSEVIGDDDCYKIRLADPKDPEPGPQGDNFTFVSKKSGLPVAFEFLSDMDGGMARLLLKDYKKFGDFTVFTTMVMNQGPQPMEIKFNVVSFDAVDEAVFAVPAELPPAEPASQPAPEPTSQPGG